MSHAYNRRRKEIRKRLGKGKINGYWKLENKVIQTRKGKKSDYVCLWNNFDS